MTELGADGYSRQDRTASAPPSRLRTWGWRLALASSVVMGLVGLLFAQSMRPSAGPYAVDRHYPFGDPLRTWQTTVGFDWIAFAILFAAASMAARRLRDRRLLAALAVSFVLLWLPHVIIGVAMVVDG